MLNKRVIARLDIKMEHLIKGVRMEGWRKIGSPIDFAKSYYDEGADELVLLDVVASLYNRNNLTEILKDISSSIHIPITIGGGIRSHHDVEELLSAGADKVAINSEATKNPNLLEDLAKTFGSQAIVLSIESKKINNNLWEPLTDNGREHTHLDSLKWAMQAEQLGVGEIFLSSIDQDGTRLGPDIELIQSVSSMLKIPVISSSGVGCLEDVKDIFTKTECTATAIGTSLHYKDFSMSELKDYLLTSSIPVRKSL